MCSNMEATMARTSTKAIIKDAIALQIVSEQDENRTQMTPMTHIVHLFSHYLLRKKNYSNIISH